MNPEINFLRALQTVAVLAAMLAFSSPVHSLYADTAKDKTMPGANGSMMDRNQMMTQHNEMMAEHGKMMADLKATDAALTDLVAKLKAAPQAQKVDLLADIVTRMVTQQTALHAEMDKMHQTMMTRKMSMMGAKCPCMMNDTDDTSPGATTPQK